MRKNIIVTLLIVLIIATVGIYYLKDSSTSNIENFSLISILSSNEQEEVLSSYESKVIAGFRVQNEPEAIFIKNQFKGTISKFICEDLPYGCIYSLDERIFLVTDSSNKKEILCYADCSSKDICKPLAITDTGYMILQKDTGTQIAIQMQSSTMTRLILPTEEISLNDLTDEEKGFIYYFVEE